MTDETQKPVDDNIEETADEEAVPVSTAPKVTITRAPETVYDEREVKEQGRMGIPLIAASLDLIEKVTANNPEARERLTKERALLEELDKRDEYVSIERDESDYWARVLVQAITQVPSTGEESFDVANADWAQQLEHNGREIRVGEARGTRKSGNTNATIAHMARRSGLGIELNVPLVHSGIYLRLRSPSIADFADFQYRMSEERLQFAMTNKGFAMSSMGYRAHDMITDFALECVTNANVPFSSPTDLKERINILDRNILHWALAAVIHPEGVDFSLPCVNYNLTKDDSGNDVSPCDHVEEERLNFKRMFFYDRNRVSKKQTEMLARGFKMMSDEDLTTYRESGVICKPKRIWLNDVLGCDIEPLTLYDYADFSQDWLQHLIDLSAGSLNEPPTNGRRQERMRRYSNAMRATQYRHWVRAVVMRSEEEDGEDDVYTDGEMIQGVLEDIFSQGALADSFIQGIVEYIRDNKVGIVAIPEYKCPKCGASNADDEYRKHHALVEIEVSTYFFMCVALKLQQQTMEI